MAKLSVNLNKIALLRNARHLNVPSVLWAAETCIKAGANGITVHPRPDERHIRQSDVYDLASLLKENDIEFNIEGNPFPDFMALVLEIKPTQCTLVPDSPEQFTSDHGWDLKKDALRLQPLISEIQCQGTRVSLFLDPDHEQIDLVESVGADRIELYTEPYARAFGTPEEEHVLDCFRQAAVYADSKGIGVNAGHDLNLKSLPRLCAITEIVECSIGHALIADALCLGLRETVQLYCQACRGYI